MQKAVDAFVFKNNIIVLFLLLSNYVWNNFDNMAVSAEMILYKA